MTWILTAAAILFCLYLVAMMEGWSAHGRWRILGPLASCAVLLQQEDVRPRQRDKVFFELAPLVLLAAATLALAVLPLSGGLIAAPIATGALFLNGALAYVMVALLMAGWAHNGVYALIGGWRFLGQLVAYSMPIVMAITAVVMRAESMAMLPIVESQAQLWNILYQPLGFVLFYLSSLALAFLPPFDLPQAPGELAGGVFAEYTGWRQAIIRFARLLLVFTLSLSVVVFFLGGSAGPLLPDLAWTLIKTLLVAFSFYASGRRIPRIQHYKTLEWSWKIATPVALFNIFLVGVLLLIL